MGKMDSIRMDNQQFIKGRWATRAEDLIGENHVFLNTATPGTLEINKGRATLDLNGKLRSGKDGLFNDFDKIYGYSNSGLFIVLEKCYITKGSLSAPGYVVEKYLVNRAFILNKPLEFTSSVNEKIEATGIKFSIDYFRDWFNIDLPTLEDINYPEDFSVNYSNHYFSTNEFDFLEGKYSLKIERKIDLKDSRENEFNVEFNPFITINTKGYRTETVEDLLHIANWTSKMNDFLIQTYGSYEYIEFCLEDEVNHSWKESLENDMVLFHGPLYSGRLVFSQLSERKSNLRADDLRLNNIKDIYGDLIRAWFENWDKLKYIVDLYYQNRIHSLDIETKVVNKIKILETYYDHFWSEEENTQNEVDPDLENAIQKTVQWVKEQDFKDEMKKKLTKKINAKWGNKISLAQKLKRLLENLPEDLKNMFSEEDPNWREDNKFIEDYAIKLKNTRNYHTHGSNEAEIRLKSIEKLSIASDILDAVIYYLILGTMGLEDEQILDLPFLEEKL
ncbi:hypothetical protein PEPNEM18_01620 [Aedoeadaptatus nemausensis]|uniref:Uncharacterized protein n=1 Tax=Aedoeadaptatus nemausensis TaxID=2582829 RepID=A0A6V6Y771_9FIRM|nr:hypothetical protein PEPNEM18_01620 [Peptoniphilus nemausensis]